ncbi:uncharacterized protein N7511_009551 [Penicillium nucicola]|uniref:uncharacterized protein n=1 Tax=Penicillium nucicola TaxID=1850975 RepID=UPI00254531A1|nr:uncharacterized protein N7511_009551 [Penicillium nucicola]KAJ5747855.1 hypothetical protein N7511_009551 [Penicillium nucicola]
MAPTKFTDQTTHVTISFLPPTPSSKTRRPNTKTTSISIMAQKSSYSVSNPPSRSLAEKSASRGDTSSRNTESLHGESNELLSNLSGKEWVQLGIDFVLSLEQPCLYRNQNNQPTGYRSSIESKARQNVPTTLNSDVRWETTVEVFHRLLEMARGLDLDGYITPVQAWNRIKNHEKFERMTRGKLGRLEISMRPHIKCQGFAAIMEEPIFEILLNQVLHQ